MMAGGLGGPDDMAGMGMGAVVVPMGSKLPRSADGVNHPAKVNCPSVIIINNFLI